MLIITYLGMEGAILGALALQKYPQADLTITSSYKIAEDLESALNNPQAQEIAVCGVGVRCAENVLYAALDALKTAGRKVTWFNGSEYFPPVASMLRRHGVQVHCGKNGDFAAAQELWKLAHTPEIALINAVYALAVKNGDINGGQPSSRTAAGRKSSKLKDEEIYYLTVRAAIHQYLNFGNHETYPQAIKKLASAAPLDANDHTLTFEYFEGGQVITGRSPQIKRLRRDIALVAPAADTPVLILGESGSGKENTAWLIHKGSRRKKSFMAVNCALFPNSELLASQLFGHVAGAYTGAVKERKGLFALADGGTLFLDEIGEMPLECQASLLRVLECHQFHPVGSDAVTYRSDVRIIAATNRDLARMVAEKRFRLDLYYRLKILPVRVPSLRERPDDIDLLAPELLAGLCRKHNRPAEKLTPHALEMLKSYSWPGNIRQLAGFLERALVTKRLGDLRSLLDEEEDFSVPACVSAAEAPAAGREKSPEPPAGRAPDSLLPLDTVIRRHAAAALRACNGNKAATCKVLRISQNTLNKYLKEQE